MKGRLVAVILSHDLQCAPTHYYAGRTRPCTGATCEACAHNHLARWNGYVAAIDLDRNEHIIIELTRNVCDIVAAEFDARRTLKGVRIMLERRAPRANARISCKLAPPATGTGELEAAPDVRPILARIWEIKDDQAIPRVAPANLPPLKTGTYDVDDHGSNDRQLDCD
jgi:hypothetical protein